MKNTKILRNIVVAGIFASILIPFISFSSLYFPFITSKAYVFRALIEVVFGVWAILAIFDKNYRPKKSLILWSFVGFLVLLFISNLKGLNPRYSFWSNFERMEGYVTLVHVFLYFIVVSSVFNTQKIWNTFLHYIIGTTFIHAFYSFLQASGKANASMSADRIDGTFGNSIYLAGFMLLSLFITIYLWMQNGNKGPLKYFYGSAILFQIITIFLSGTRGAVLGLIAGVFIALVSYAFLETNKKFIRYGLIGFVVAVTLFMSVVFGMKDSSFVQNTTILKRMSEISLQSGTVQARLINWGIAWSAIKERPLLGYGQGNYSEIFDQNYDVRLWSQENWFDRSHSLIFDWLVAGGFLGFIAYVSIFIFAIYYLWRYSDKFSNAEKAALTAFFVGYFVHTAFVFDNITSYMLLFIVFALIHSRLDFKFNVCEKIKLPKIASNILVIIVVLVTPYSVWAVNTDSYIQNRELISAMKISSVDDIEDSLQHFQKALNKNSFGQQEVLLQFLSYAVRVNESDTIPDQIKNNFYQTALTEAQKYINDNSDDVRTLLVAGQYFAQVGNYDLANQYLDKMILLAPKKQFLYQPKIEVLFVTGKTKEAKDLLNYAYEINSENDSFWEYYIRTLSRADEIDLYRELFEKAFAEGRGYRVVNLSANNLKNNPENINAYVTLAVSHYRNGETEIAIEIINEAISKFPSAKKQLEDVMKKINAGQKVF